MGRVAERLSAELDPVRFDHSLSQLRLSSPERCHTMIDAEHVGRVYRHQGWVSPVILVNGRIAGVWSHKRTGRRLAVELEPFKPLPAWASRQLAAETRRLAEFLDDCELSA